MEGGGVVLLTRIVPGGPGLAAPQKGEGRRLWGEPLALGVTQVLLGALQAAVGGALLGALGDPVGAQLGTPVGSGALLVLSGAVLVAMAQRPAVGRARAALALGVLAAIVSLLELGLQGLLLPHGCHGCFAMGPAGQGTVLGAQALLLTSSAGGAALAVMGAVAAARGRKGAGAGPPVVIYQTATPPGGLGAGLGQAPPPAAAAVSQ